MRQYILVMWIIMFTTSSVILFGVGFALPRDALSTSPFAAVGGATGVSLVAYFARKRDM